jgi:hypothetical protein
MQLLTYEADTWAVEYAKKIQQEAKEALRGCLEFCVQGGLKFHCLLPDFTPRVS